MANSSLIVKINAEEIAEKVLDEFTYEGKTLRQIVSELKELKDKCTSEDYIKEITEALYLRDRVITCRDLGYRICEFFENYDMEENDCSEYIEVKSFDELLNGDFEKNDL